ncbi:MAG: hypothetical protein PVJ43_12720 [Gemmatimonadales bacterium]|jgi:hypothetical protein
MRTLAKALLSGGTVGILLSVYACGASTGVYVGVAVPGPYVGYPGVGYPGYVGRPPYVYEEDAFNLPAESRDRVATSGSTVNVRPQCGPDSEIGMACEADTQGQSITAPSEAMSSGPEGAGRPDRDD